MGKGNFKKTALLILVQVFLGLFASFSYAIDGTKLGPLNSTSNDYSWAITETGTAGINLNEAWKQYTLKKEVIVAVVDTGVDPNHPLLAEKLFINRGQDKAISNNFGHDFSKDAGEPLKPLDTHGHGTHISGIISTVFPKVKILTLKYYNQNADEQANLNSTVKALEYAVNIGVDIINYSSGGAGASFEELSVLKKAQEKGILVVAAAGNYGSNIDDPKNHYYPASYGLDNIITVVNHDQSLQLNPTSNYGMAADISAPGSRILSSLPSGRMGYLSGTSQSTAFVSGVAALLKSTYPEFDYKAIKQLIIDSAVKVPTLTGKCKSGGVLNAGKVMGLANSLKNSSGQRQVANF